MLSDRYSCCLFIPRDRRLTACCSSPQLSRNFWVSSGTSHKMANHANFWQPLLWLQKEMLRAKSRTTPVQCNTEFLLCTGISGENHFSFLQQWTLQKKTDIALAWSKINTNKSCFQVFSLFCHWLPRVEWKALFAVYGCIHLPGPFDLGATACTGLCLCPD